jgi:hypothetical protein
MRKMMLVISMAMVGFVAVSCSQGETPAAKKPAVVSAAAAVQGRVAQDILIDDFEGAVSGGLDGTVDYGTGNGASLEVSAATDIKNTGNQSLKVVYTEVPGGYMWIARGFGLDAKNTAWLVNNNSIDWKGLNALSFFMYGSNSNAQLAVDIKDNGGEIWRFLVTDNFSGWKEVVCPFAEFYPRDDWQPDNADKNGVIDFPVKSYQFEPRTDGTGTWYFDTVRIIKK